MRFLRHWDLLVSKGEGIWRLLNTVVGLWGLEGGGEEGNRVGGRGEEEGGGGGKEEKGWRWALEEIE